jgi:hypothetical protein
MEPTTSKSGIAGTDQAEGQSLAPNKGNTGTTNTGNRSGTQDSNTSNQTSQTGAYKTNKS